MEEEKEFFENSDTMNRIDQNHQGKASLEHQWPTKNSWFHFRVSFGGKDTTDSQSLLVFLIFYQSRIVQMEGLILELEQNSFMVLFLNN